MKIISDILSVFFIFVVKRIWLTRLDSGGNTSGMSGVWPSDSKTTCFAVLHYVTFVNLSISSICREQPDSE